MRLSALLTSAIAFVTAGLLLLGAWLLLRPSGPPLAAASLSPAAISPNADGHADVARIQYTLRRPATVSIYFLDGQGDRFDFRKDKLRDGGAHEIDFSGIVDPYRLPGDDFQAELFARVLQNGAYTWVIEARDAQGNANRITGPLAVSDLIVASTTGSDCMTSVSVGAKMPRRVSSRNPASITLRWSSVGPPLPTL